MLNEKKIKTLPEFIILNSLVHKEGTCEICLNIQNFNALVLDPKKVVKELVKRGFPIKTNKENNINYYFIEEDDADEILELVEAWDEAINAVLYRLEKISINEGSND